MTMNLVEREGEEDYFNGLPAEVEAECLFRCKLVSKRFASFISQLRLRSLSFFVPCSIVRPKYSYFRTRRAKLWIFLKTLVSKIFPNLILLHPCQLEVLAPSFNSINQFLSNFEQIRSVCLVFLVNYEAPCEFKWYAEFKDSKKLDFFVMLSFESIDDMKQEDDDEQTDHHHHHHHHPEDDDNEFVMGHLVHAILYQSFMRNYLDDHILKQQLENVEITDIKRHGKVRVRQERIGDFRSLEQKKQGYVMEWEDELPAMGMPFCEKVWRVPKLRIGSSKRVMKRAKLVAVRPMHWEADEFEDGLLEGDDFEYGLLEADDFEYGLLEGDESEDGLLEADDFENGLLEADEFEDGLLEAATAFEQEEAELGEAVRQMLMDKTTNMTTNFRIFEL